MSELEGFRSLAATVRANTQVGLSSDRSGIVPRTGRLARWIGRFRAGENRAVAARFVASLRTRYGRELADHMLVSSGLDRVLTTSRPLRARQVQQACDRADALQESVRARNAALSAFYTRPVERGAELSPLDLIVRAAVERSFPGRPAMTDLLDRPALALKVQRAVVDAGHDGTRFVTSGRAAAIASEVVRDELGAAADHALGAALGKLAMDVPGSIALTALRNAAASRVPSLSIDPGRLTADVRAALSSRLQDQLRHGGVPLNLLGDDAGLQALADEVMAGFVAERASAESAIATLPGLAIVSPAEKEALRDHVLHDNVGAHLAPSMAWAYVLAAQDVADLAAASNPAYLEAGVTAIRHAITGAFVDAGVRLDAATRGPMHRAAWRFLLAPGGPAQAAAIAAQLQPAASPLRAIGEGAMWYRDVFPATTEANKSFVSMATDEVMQDVYPEESFSEATSYAVMLSSLADVLGEHTSEQPVKHLAARENVPDQAIASLRNLGIPMPAPDRLGEANPDVPISAAGLAAVRGELADHLRSKGGGSVNEHGVYEESARDFARATYCVEGQVVDPTEAAVTEALREFCRDADGDVNAGLLRSVSLMAYQAGTGCAMAAVCDPGRRDLAIFNGFPQANQRDQYNLSRDVNGDVILECSQAGPIQRLDRQNLEGIVDMVQTDPANSHLGLSIRFRIDAATYQTRFEDLNISYALAPNAAEPDDVASTEAAQEGVP